MKTAADPARVHKSRIARSLLAALVLVGSPAWGDVTSSGDVSPTFTVGPVVALTGQRLLLGFTAGGQGTGVVTVNGAGSAFNLAGGAGTSGFDVGSWGNGTLTISNGGLIACATVAACQFNSIGNAAGSTGRLEIVGGTVSGLGQLAVGLGNLLAGFGTAGANASATLSITNGGALSSNGFNTVASNSGQTGIVTGNVTISGAGSNWAITRDLAGGGGQAFLGIAPSSNSNASVTISDGGNLNITGSRANPAADNSLPGIGMSTAAGATSNMTVTSGGSVRIGGDTGFIVVGGNSSGISSVSSPGANATLNITGGGTVAGTGPNGISLMVIGQNLGTGTVNISGVGSQVTVAGVGGQNTQGLDGVGGLVQVGRNRNNGGGGNGTLNVSAGGSLVISDNGLVATPFTMGLRVASGADSIGSVTVTGAGSSIVISSTGGSEATPHVLVGNGGIGQMTISNGASVSLQSAGQRNFTVGNSATGSGTLNVTNGGVISASRFAVGDNGGSGVATINNSTIKLDGSIFTNGTNGTPFGAGVRIGRGDGANGTLNLQNGATININNTNGSAGVVLGGTSTLGGGTGTLNMSGGSSINLTGSAPNAALLVGNTAGGIGIMTMTGNSVVNMGATGSAIVGNAAGSVGTLTISGGSAINANVIGIGGNSTTVAGGVGTAVVTGLGSKLNATGESGFIGVGRGGTGSLTVSNRGAVESTFLIVGRAAGGSGTMTVDNAAITLSGQQTTGTLSGAALSIGSLSGTGVASISNSSVVNITNFGTSGASLNVGGTPNNALGTGTLTVANSQINISAAPGLAVARIGHDGTGTATFNASTLNIGAQPVATAAARDGLLLVAGLAGSTGTLTLNTGSVVNAGHVGIGATQAGQGGTGHLILNNGTINTTTFELGRNSVLSGDNGTINATGDVIIGGTLDPGNSPGRININCNLVTLAGSRLILEIAREGKGFAVDHVTLGSESTFKLLQLEIVFTFLGDIDPTTYAASGGFNLDNFLQVDLGGGVFAGLSQSAQFGKSWAEVVTAKNIKVDSDFYDVSDLKLGDGGVITLNSAPIPEPSTWALLLLGLLVLNVVARRRQQAGACRSAIRSR